MQATKPRTALPQTTAGHSRCRAAGLVASSHRGRPTMVAEPSWIPGFAYLDRSLPAGAWIKPAPDPHSLLGAFDPSPAGLFRCGLGRKAESPDDEGLNAPACALDAGRKLGCVSSPSAAHTAAAPSLVASLATGRSPATTAATHPRLLTAFAWLSTVRSLSVYGFLRAVVPGDVAGLL